jgi:hypothetical protein
VSRTGRLASWSPFKHGAANGQFELLGGLAVEPDEPTIHGMELTSSDEEWPRKVKLASSGRCSGCTSTYETFGTQLAEDLTIAVWGRVNRRETAPVRWAWI